MLRIKEPSQTSPSIPLRWAQKPLLDFVPLGWGFDPAGLPALLTVKSILQRDLLFTSPVSWLFQLPCESGCDVSSVTPEIDKGIRSPDGSFVPFEILFAPSGLSEHLPCVRNKCRQIATSLDGVGGEWMLFIWCPMPSRTPGVKRDSERVFIGKRMICPTSQLC